MQRLLDQELVGHFFGVGSVGEQTPEAALEYVKNLVVPYWYQVPAIHEEDMVRQFAYEIEGFEDDEQFVVDVDMYGYREIVDDDSPILIDEEHAHGLYLLMREGPFRVFKTQQTAPSTMAFTVRGSDGRQLVSQSMIRFFSVLMKRFAKGQVEILRPHCEKIILCQDDPAFGFVIDMVRRGEAGEISVEQIVRETESVYPKDVIPSYHYCEDWRVLEEKGKHLLWDTLPKLAHIDVVSYPPEIDPDQGEKINKFIERGGALVLGVLPNTDDVYTAPVIETFQNNLRSTLDQLVKNTVSIDLLAENVMVSTQCGLSRASPNLTREIHEKSGEFANIFHTMVRQTT
ncbi:MAG: hypothetical protein K9W43_03715 [Candidatus Thorarchaeota archaeon]|nr:hypothetical protein [Candidatus Thorarchaeota archaeon]